MTPGVAERFWGKVKKGDGCWEWQASTGRGYGKMQAWGRLETAPRVAWILSHGPIPRGMFVCHHCDNPLCVKAEPDAKYPHGHLFLGTPLDNMRDMIAKGRKGAWPLPPEKRRRGRQVNGAALCDYCVRYIKALCNERGSQRRMSRLFDINESAISKIVSGKAWRHV